VSELAEGDPSLVVALRYDEVAVAQDLAAWCGGELEVSDDADQPPRIWVPTDKGPRPASLGDWIVRRMTGGYYPCSPEDFAARHSPAE
jgi:hypothetical protein